MFSLFIGMVMLACGAMMLGVFLFILFVMLGIFALLIKGLIKRKASKRIETKNLNKCSMKELILGMLTKPKEVIELESISSYSWVSCTICSAVIIIILSFVTMFVAIEAKGIITKLIGTWISAWILIVAAIIIRWFFTKVNTLVFMYVGKVEMSEVEGNRIFNIVFIGGYIIMCLLEIISHIFPKYLCLHYTSNDRMHYIPVLGCLSLVWAWYIEYLLLKERYHLSSQQSSVRVGLMIVAKVCIIATFIIAMIISVKGIFSLIV